MMTVSKDQHKQSRSSIEKHTPFLSFLSSNSSSSQRHLHRSLSPDCANESRQRSCLCDNADFNFRKRESSIAGCKDNVTVDDRLAAASIADAIHGGDDGLATTAARETGEA